MGNLPYSVHDQDIYEFFFDCDVVDIYLVKDRETGDMKVNISWGHRRENISVMYVWSIFCAMSAVIESLEVKV